MPLQQQKGWNLGDGQVHGSWEGQLDCKTGWTGKNGKNSCNSRKIAGNKQDVRGITVKELKACEETSSPDTDTGSQKCWERCDPQHMLAAVHRGEWILACHTGLLQCSRSKCQRKANCSFLVV